MPRILEESASAASVATSASSAAASGEGRPILIRIAVTAYWFRFSISSSAFADDFEAAILHAIIVLLGARCKKLALVSVFATVLSCIALLITAIFTFFLFILLMLLLLSLWSLQRHTEAVAGDDAGIFLLVAAVRLCQIKLTAGSWLDWLALSALLFLVRLVGCLISTGLG